MHLIPMRGLRRMGVPDGALLHVSIFLTAVLVALVVPLLRFIPHFCLAKTLLHVPCPGCGVTTGLLALSRLDFAGGWRANPASVLFALSLLFALTAQPIAVACPGVRETVRSVSQRLSQVVIFALVAVWVARLL